MSGKTQDIIQECTRLQKFIQKINDKHYGPLNKLSARSTMYPFILLLGNHSSGKSSFVNYLLNREVQVAGVAPTDDCFSIIGWADEDADKDGPALIGDPDLGFSSLAQFGSNLVHKTVLRLRSNIAVSNSMIVDTPGMIDSPGQRGQNSEDSSKHYAMDRGYDFEGVCRWYAERADVILLFFDPDKPGTTGETLSILTNSLVGLDHKLHIILNKADQFRKIHDFARAYGSLCWNLSKVIQRKDLPQIHTMYVPNQQVVGTEPCSPTIHDDRDVRLTSNFLDLDQSRENVVKEVLNAPKRRVDHEISRLTGNLQELLMHCRVYDSAVADYQSMVWALRCVTAVCGGLSMCTTFLVSQLPSEWFPLPSKARLPTKSFAASVHPDTNTSGVRSISAETRPSTTASDLIAGVATEPNSSNSSDSSSGSATSSSSPLADNVSNSIASSFRRTASATPTEAVSSWPNIFSMTSIARFFHREVGVFRATLIAAAAGIAVTAGVYYWQEQSLRRRRRDLGTIEPYQHYYERIFSREISDHDESVTTMWSRVQERLKTQLPFIEIATSGRIATADFEALERIKEDDILRLRRQAANNNLCRQESRRTNRTATTKSDASHSLSQQRFQDRSGPAEPSTQDRTDEREIASPDFINRSSSDHPGGFHLRSGDEEERSSSSESSGRISPVAGETPRSVRGSIDLRPRQTSLASIDDFFEHEDTASKVQATAVLPSYSSTPTGDRSPERDPEEESVRPIFTVGAISPMGSPSSREKKPNRKDRVRQNSGVSLQIPSFSEWEQSAVPKQDSPVDSNLNSQLS